MSHPCLSISVFQVFAGDQSYFYVREITEAKEKGWVKSWKQIVFSLPQTSVKMLYFYGK